MNRINPYDNNTFYIFLKEESEGYEPTIKINQEFLRSLTEFLKMDDEEDIVVNGNLKEWCLFFTMIIEKYLSFRENDDEILDVVLSDLKRDGVFSQEVTETFLKLVSNNVKITENTEINMKGSVIDFERYFQLLKIIDYQITQSLKTNYRSVFKIKE